MRKRSLLERLDSLLTILFIVIIVCCLIMSAITSSQLNNTAGVISDLQSVVESQLSTQQELLDYVKELEARVAELEGNASNDHALPNTEPQQPRAAEPTGVLYDCAVTYYCAEQYAHICNNGPPFGVTASGATLVPYQSCAVDPSIIPLGSEVVVEFKDGTTWNLLAHDTGGAIDGHKIDIAVSTHDEALKLGRDVATVYWYG